MVKTKKEEKNKSALELHMSLSRSQLSSMEEILPLVGNSSSPAGCMQTSDKT